MTSSSTRPPHLERVYVYLDRVHLKLSNNQVLELPGDASDRQYVRITPQNRSSVILLVHENPFDESTLSFINVANLLKEMPIPIPKILNIESDLGILVLEDLGDITLENHLARVDLTSASRFELYEEAVGLIALMQVRGRELESNRYHPFGQAFDVEKLTWELEFFVEHFLIGHRGLTLSDTDRSSLVVEFKVLAGVLAAEPRVFCHRDFHSRNLILHDGRLYVLDFQDARMGPDTYDLVSLLRDSYVDLDRPLVDQTITTYFTQLGVPEPEDFRVRFDRMTVQRHLKALGTFGFQASVVGTSRYSNAVCRTLKHLRDIFDRDLQFVQLRDLLAPHIHELR